MLTNLSAFYTKYARRVVTDCSGHSFTHLDVFVRLQAAGGGQHSVILANVSEPLNVFGLAQPPLLANHMVNRIHAGALDVHGDGHQEEATGG